MGLVTALDAAQQVLVGVSGSTGRLTGGSHMPVAHALCKYVVAAGAPVAIADLRRHPRLLGCPAVTERGIVAYAGVPLTTAAGEHLGGLCVLDDAPHTWTDDDVAALCDLALVATAALGPRPPSARPADDRGLLGALRDGGGAGVCELDLAARCTAVNTAAAGMLGFAAEDLLGRDIHLVLHTGWDGAPQHELDRCPIASVLRSGLRLGPEETVLRGRDGSRFYAECAVAPVIVDGCITGGVLSFRDLTRRKRLEERLAQQAQTDVLTGLANRAAFVARLGDALARAQQERGTLAVVLLDIDGFAGVNDRLGQQHGDHLLVDAGRRLATCVRHGDLVARSGSDEFAVLLEKVSGEAEALRVTERLLAGLRPAFSLGGAAVTVSASAGIALTGADPANADALLRGAAAALRQARAAMPGHAMLFPATTTAASGIAAG